MQAEVARGLPQRAFWATVLVADLLLLLLLSRITVVAAAVGLGVLIIAFVGRVEWFLALLVLGTPLFDLLSMDDTGFAWLVPALRLLFLGGWLLALTRLGESPTGAAGRVLRDPRTITVLLLAVWIWMGLLWTEAPVYGEGKAKSFLLANVFFFLAGAAFWPLWRDRRRLDRFLRAGIVMGAVIAAAGVAAATGIVNDLILGDVGQNRNPAPIRLAWLGANAIGLSRLLAIWLVLLLWSVHRRLLRPALGGLLVVAALFLMLRTGSRGPLTALLLSPIALLLLPRPSRLSTPLPAEHVSMGPSANRTGRRRRILYALAAGALIIVLLFLVLPPQEKARVVSAVFRGPVASVLGPDGLGEGFSQVVSERFLRDPSSLLRLDLARRSIEVLGTGLPWGVGTGGFATTVFLRDFRIYPHNLEAELLIENGLPGLLLFFLLMLLIWRDARRLACRNPAARWIWILLVMAVLNAQVSGDMTGNAEIWLWGGLLVGLRMAASSAGRALGSDAHHSLSHPDARF